MANVRYVKFKKWAGWKIRGTTPVESPAVDDEPSSHADRIFYLVSQLEAPSWGGVQNYDGVAMSAGPIHNIAVHRDGSQGSLIRMLRHLEVNAHTPEVQELFDMLKAVGWYVAQDGRMRHLETGAKIRGRDIVTEFSGPKGVAPKTGEGGVRSRGWVLAFHHAFSAPDTFEAQKQFALDWILNSQETIESMAYRVGLAKGPNDDFDSDDAAVMRIEQLGEELDLAMCVYHAHSVNAPGKAKSVLKALLNQYRGNNPATAAGRRRVEQFPARLIRKLGTTKYARWHDTPDNKNRYDRTRIAARRSGLWTKTTLNKLMPKDF